MWYLIITFVRFVHTEILSLSSRFCSEYSLLVEKSIILDLRWVWEVIQNSIQQRLYTFVLQSTSYQHRCEGFTQRCSSDCTLGTNRTNVSTLKLVMGRAILSGLAQEVTLMLLAVRSANHSLTHIRMAPTFLKTLGTQTSILLHFLAVLPHK